MNFYCSTFTIKFFSKYSHYALAMISERMIRNGIVIKNEILVIVLQGHLHIYPQRMLWKKDLSLEARGASQTRNG